MELYGIIWRSRQLEPLGTPTKFAVSQIPQHHSSHPTPQHRNPDSLQQLSPLEGSTYWILSVLDGSTGLGQTGLAHLRWHFSPTTVDHGNANWQNPTCEQRTGLGWVSDPTLQQEAFFISQNACPSLRFKWNLVISESGFPRFYHTKWKYRWIRKPTSDRIDCITLCSLELGPLLWRSLLDQCWAVGETVPRNGVPLRLS